MTSVCKLYHVYPLIYTIHYTHMCTCAIILSLYILESISQVNGVYEEPLGELIGQVCAAEGKFRQLNAIKEGTCCQYGPWCGGERIAVLCEINACCVSLSITSYTELGYLVSTSFFVSTTHSCLATATSWNLPRFSNYPYISCSHSVLSILYHCLPQAWTCSWSSRRTS